MFEQFEASASRSAPPEAEGVRLTLVVNGERRDMPAGATISDLLERVGVGTAACAVEVNRTLAPKATHATRRLRDGDEVEIVTLVGGG